MKRLLVFTMMLVTLSSVGVLALGGGGGAEDAGDNTLKVSMKPLDESSKTYGWVRITEDQFNLGANRLEKDQFYSVYFVTGDEKEPVGEKPVTRSSGVGEVKFGARLTEPVDGKWDKIVLYHQPNGEESTEGMSPVLEGSLR
ncbi:MAG: hypothetical protein KC910_10675 [Candidatus Eremiobacteraeota bacterium]|nr:hypothetical protein [Candidatus Eremiobacteraeota bacterium]